MIGRWFSVTQRTLITEREDGRRLMCIVAKGTRFVAVALETAVDAPDSAAVFDDHSHHEIGKFLKLDRALRAAERYARVWSRRARRSEPCPCPEIKPR